MSARAPIRLLPDLMALLTAGVGMLAFDGIPRLLCGLALLAALARAGTRLTAKGALGAADTSLARSSLASLPALALLVGILVSWGPAPKSPVRAAVPAVPVDLSALPDTARDCLATEAAKRYLDALYRKLDETWDEQEEPTTGGFVELGFVLEKSGGVQHSRVIDQSSDEYRALGSAVLEASAPFGELGGELGCLSGVELRATLDRSPGH